MYIRMLLFSRLTAIMTYGALQRALGRCLKWSNHLTVDNPYNINYAIDLRFCLLFLCTRLFIYNFDLICKSIA
jgi:hypothetical protein